MQKLAFTIIELIIVVLIIGIVSFLSIQLPSSITKKTVTILNLREALYPNSTFYVLKDKQYIKETNQTLNLFSNDIEVYKYDGKEFKLVDFGYLKDDKILFKYSVKNGIGDSYIIKDNETYYIFKPFYIKKTNSFENAKNEFLLTQYMPKIGEYY